MINYTKRILLFFSVVILLVGCKKKFDDYYKRPDNLEAPIYQQLQDRGNFAQLLSLIDKAGYKQTLSSAGYWTLFAPNDLAFGNDADFKNYLQQRNIPNVGAIDSVTARAIVQYLLVYNAFDKTRIDDYQSSAGWVPDQAFRRRTAYYTGFYKDTMSNGNIVTAIQSNRNGSTTPYVSADNNNKYIPYFTDTFFNAKTLTASDYTYFYPNSQYTGFNLAQAKISQESISAENGIIYEIDRVITPMPSIDEYLRSKPEYREFKKLYDKYMVSYILNADATSRYKILTGKDDPVYVKAYNSLLAYSPNNENYLKLQDNDGQQGSWTMFVPKNDVLLNYVNNVLLEYFKTLENAPPQVIADFLNAHMWINPVWPSKFDKTFNFLGEEARFNPQTDIIDRKVLSNGFLYGTNKVQEANVFSTVYGKPYLNPKYSLMVRLLSAELKFIISNPKQKFTLFMMSDSVINAAGYTFSSLSNSWTYTPPGGGAAVTGEAARQRLLRILNTSVIPQELTNLSGSGIVAAYNNELIKWNNNQVISVGTQDAGKIVMVDSVKTANNGKVYYLNGLLTFTDTAIGRHIIKLGGTSTASNYYYFARYLQNSTAYSSSGTAFGEIVGTQAGTFYTIFVPSNEAIMQAVKDGILPGDQTTGVPNVNPSLPADRLLVDNFIRYHVLTKNALIPTEVRDFASYESLLKNPEGEVLPISVAIGVGSMQIKDMNNRSANLIIAESNRLSNRAVIHLIDNYLKYTF